MVEVAKNWKSRFFTIWIGEQLSLTGSRAAQFALVWWLTTTTGSATVLATATTVALIPQILLGPLAGAFVDRWNRRMVLLVSDSFIALVSLWLAYMFWSGAMQVWHVYVVMLARSLGDVFQWPAMAASTSLMVPERHLTRVAGLNQTMNGMLTIAGPPLGALLLALLPLHGVMLVDVGTALFAVIPLMFIPIPQPARAEGVGAKMQSVWHDLRDGFRYLRGWPGAVALISGALIFKVALTPAFSLLPLLVKSHFGGGAGELSLLESIAGIGMVTGGLALSAWGGFRRKVLTLLMGLSGVGLGVVALGFTPSYLFPVALGSMFFLGCMIPMTDGPIMAIFQTTIAPNMQGRVFALLGSLVSLSSPLGLAIAGPVSDRLGIQIWFIIAGFLCLSVAFVSFFIPAIMHIEENHTALRQSAESEGAPGQVATEPVVPEPVTD
jgi:MFS transporter, DHA3 family, macrolide efflux protein